MRSSRAVLFAFVLVDVEHVVDTDRAALHLCEKGRSRSSVVRILVVVGPVFVRVGKGAAAAQVAVTTACVRPACLSSRARLALQSLLGPRSRLFRQGGMRGALGCGWGSSRFWRESRKVGDVWWRNLGLELRWTRAVDGVGLSDGPDGVDDLFVIRIIVFF